MDYGDRVYRQLYARGGLSDQLSAAVGMRTSVRGLGDISPEMASAIARVVNRGNLFVAGPVPDPIPTNPPPVAVDMPPIDCACALSNIQGDAATMERLAALCAQDPVAFGSAMAQQGIPLDCAREWYMQPKTWLIAGGVVAAGVVLWAVL